jgi:hypothetical protein
LRYDEKFPLRSISERANVALHHYTQSMILPDLNHLQILVIEALGSEKVAGRELRQRLKKLGAAKSGPAFYQLMSRLEESKFVEGEYTQKVVDGQIFKERLYRVTGQGARAAQSTIQFYSKLQFQIA